MLNTLTIDVEDYYHATAFGHVVDKKRSCTSEKCTTQRKVSNM